MSETHIERLRAGMKVSIVDFENSVFLEKFGLDNGSKGIVEKVYPRLNLCNVLFGPNHHRADPFEITLPCTNLIPC